jgi:hypothetical protein
VNGHVGVAESRSGAMTASTALRVSAICQLVLALYFEAIQWFRLGAWNNQPKFEPLWNQVRAGSFSASDLIIVLAFFLPCTLFILAWRRGWSWLMWCCVAGYGGWLFLQIRTWWISYLFGASENWKAVYQRTFSQTTKILPSAGIIDSEITLGILRDSVSLWRRALCLAGRVALCHGLRVPMTCAAAQNRVPMPKE